MLRRARLLSLFLLFVASAALAQWEPVSAGIDYRRITRDTIDVHVVRVDVKNPALRLVATAAEDRQTTVSEFAARRKAIVAVNGDYFDEKTHWPLGRALGACGVWWNGAKLKRNQGLVAVGKGRADIQRNTQKTRRWMRGAVSGWPMLVEDCKVIDPLPGSDFFTRAPHPRTAAGLSGDGRTLYLVVAEGRREGVPGMTLPELARFMADELGACRAMNLDGGGSSAMWVKDRIVNTPSDGVEREVGNHLAVVAAADEPACSPRERKAKR